MSPETLDPRGVETTRRDDPGLTFGFLAHPTSPGHRNQVRGMDLLSRLLDEHRGVKPPTTPRYTVPVPLFTSLTSLTGSQITGEVRYLPYTAEQMLRRPTTARKLVATEVTRLCDTAGTQLVGLGGATSIVGDRGLWTAEQVDVPVTSGNSLTTYAAYQELLHVAQVLDLRPEQTTVAVVGYPGSIALAATRLLLTDGFRLELVCRQGNRLPESMLRHLDPDVHDRVRLIDDVTNCSEHTRLYLCASSVGGLVHPERLRPGSVVIDVALPRDVAALPRDSQNVLIIDGGLVSACDAVKIGDGSMPAPTRQLNGCLAETMVLAFEGRAESFSLGRDLDIEQVRTIGSLAERHGFSPLPLASFGRPAPDEHIARLAPLIPTPRPSRAPAQGEPLGRATQRRFRQHVNPPMARLLGAHGMDHVFTRGEGCTLTTADGVDYLDFVAGYGCLNLGHNHPKVTAQLRRFLDSASPAFVQYVSLPAQSAELAERLTSLAPGRPARVFFSNSGTEAVEAALKVARAGTGRARLVHAHNSYHGKTLGALSVTGRDTHQRAFQPLLPETVGIPYGDIDALSAVIDGAAAFIVEPVQGEGGVVLPPAGYLKQAREVCRRAGAAFILDEIQTGLGRTGALFAAEHDDLDPDVLCVAKSLSGGLVPIAATLCDEALWDAAYGSTDRSMLHSSTFGGGNFAAAAGLATLDVLLEDDLPRRARQTGHHLRRRLHEVCRPYDFVKEIRGVGMMNAIEFDGDFSGAVQALTDELLTRLPGDLRSLTDWLPDDLSGALSRAGTALESTAGDLMCLRFVSSLARDHRILTFVTANHTRVMRIQPPLVLDIPQADQFVDGVEAVCRQLALHADLSAWRQS